VPAARRAAERGPGAGAAVPSASPLPVARPGGVRPRARVHSPVARVAGLRNEEVARAVERDALRAVELGRGGGPAVAAEALRPVARHGRDRPRARVDSPDSVVVVVLDVEVDRADQSYCL